MSGIELAGFILGIFPVVVEVVNWYGAVVHGGDTKYLADSLENNRKIFLNSVEFLLRSIVPAQAQDLLEHPEGDGWKDESLGDKVTDQLGGDASLILEKIADIHKTIIKLKEKLPERNTAKPDKNIVARGKKVIKCFVQAPHCKTSLEKLKTSISEFRTLTEDALKLAPTRNVVPKALRNLDLVQECASGLHDALQGGWQCECDHPHPANIKLDVWSVPPEEGIEKGKGDISLKFSFLFAEDADHAHADHWVTAEITPLKGSPKGSPNGSPHGKRPFVLGSLGDASKRSITVESGTASTQPISLSRSYSIPNKVEDNVNQETIADVIQDLCTLLKEPTERPPATRHRMGSISNDKVEGVFFNEPDKLPTIPTRKSDRLSELLVKQNSLPMKNRVQIALMLAWGVLQISSTSWLSGKWTRDNILLVSDSPNNPIPYVSHRFQSSRRLSQVSTLDPEAPNHLANWIRNASLFALGVFLIEMCYNRTIENLAIDEEKNEGKPTPHTVFLTAMRLSHTVQDEIGLQYASAVNACLLPQHVDTDSDGNPKDSSQFARSILKNIIEPLKTCADSFGK